MGVSRLSRSEVRLWEEDEGVSLARWERKAIMAVDQAWAGIAAATPSNKSKQGA